jgi:hypothetical protein
MASRRFRNRGHDCLGPHDSHRAVTTRWELLREMVSSGALYTAASCADHGPLRVHWQGRTTTSKFQDTTSRKAVREKDVDPTRGFTASPEVGPGTTIGTPQTGYPYVQLQVKMKGKTCPHARPHVIGIGLCHLGMGSSGAATSPVASASKPWLRAAQVPPHVSRHQVQSPGSRQLGCCHVSHGASHCILS